MNSRSKKNYLAKSAKIDLQKKIISSSKDGVVLLSEKDLKTLGLVFGKKNNIVCLIDEVLFVGYKLLNEKGNFDYIFYRRLDKNSKPHEISLIDESQAKKIGLHEGIKKVKIGDEIFKIHYVSPDVFPQKFKKFALREKGPKINDDKFLTHFFDINAADRKLQDFFEELRNFGDLELKKLESTQVPPQPESQKPKPEEKYVNLTALANNQQFFAKDITVSDAFNINSVQKTGYHYLSDNELINVRYQKWHPSEIDYSFQHSFKNVDNFWNKLTGHYDVKVPDLDRKLRNIANQEYKHPIFAKEQSELDITVKSKDGKDNLLPKKEYLEKKEVLLKEKIDSLKVILGANGVVFDDSNEYLELQKKLEETQGELAKLAEAIDLLTKENAHLHEKYSNFTLRNYTHVQAKPEILVEKQDFVLKNLSSFDEQLNEVEYRKKEFEELLVSRLESTHNAKKAKVRFDLDLLSKNDESKRNLISQAEAQKARLQKLARDGRIQENAMLIQSQIELETAKITNSIETLKEFNLIDNYETHISELNKLQNELNLKQKELNEVLFNAKVKLLKRQRFVVKETNQRNKFLANFENEVYQLAQKLSDEIKNNFDSVWKLWNTKGISAINEIFTKKIELLSQISHVISAQIDRLSVEQMKLLEVAKEHQSDWQKVYSEVVAEYREKGYYLEKPKILPYDGIYEEDPAFVKVELTPSIEKIIQLDYNATLPANFDKQTKYELFKVGLLGLNPSLKDDDEYLIIDQIGDELTEEQKIELERKKAEMDAAAQAKADFEAAEAALLLEKEKEVTLEMERVAKEQAILNEKLEAENKILEEKLNFEEKEALEIVRKRAQLSSDITETFKKDVLKYAQKLVTEKQAKLINKEIVFSKSGNFDENEMQIFSEKDYFLQPQGISLDETSSVLDLKSFDDTNMTDNKLFLEAIIEPSSEEKSNFAIGDLQTNEESNLAEFDPMAHPTENADLNEHLKENNEDQDVPFGLQANDELYTPEDQSELSHLLEGDQDESKHENYDKSLVSEDGDDQLKVKTEVVEKIIYKSPKIDLSEIKTRIQRLDEEIQALSRYTERNEHKVEQAVKMRDELKEQFDKQMDTTKLLFTSDQDKINAYLKQEVLPLENNGDDEIGDAIEYHELNFHPKENQNQEPDLDPSVHVSETPTYFDKVEKSDQFLQPKHHEQPEVDLSEPSLDHETTELFDHSQKTIEIPKTAEILKEENLSKVPDAVLEEFNNYNKKVAQAHEHDHEEGFEPYNYEDDDHHEFKPEPDNQNNLDTNQFDQWPTDTHDDLAQVGQPSENNDNLDKKHDEDHENFENHDLNENTSDHDDENVEVVEQTPKESIFKRLKGFFGKKSKN